MQDDIDKFATLEINHSGRLITLVAHEKDPITRAVQQSGTFYEWQMLKALDEYICPEDLVLDVGADIGNHSVYFAAVHSARVIAYEAVPATANILQRNIEYNFLDDKVRIRRVGLGNMRTSSRSRGRDTDSRKAEAFMPGSGEIVVTTLDMEGIRDRVSLIRVDVEGMDIDVLRGAVGLITRNRPVIVCKAADQTSLDSLIEFTVDIGYTFAGKYNATPTYILVPYRSDLERACHERRMATFAVQTNILARDLNYRLSLISQRLTDVEKAIIDHRDDPREYDSSLSLAHRISAMDQRLDQIQNATSN
jgi:FkbM family methyltransferase